MRGNKPPEERLESGIIGAVGAVCGAAAARLHHVMVVLLLLLKLLLVLQLLLLMHGARVVDLLLLYAEIADIVTAAGRR